MDRRHSRKLLFDSQKQRSMQLAHMPSHVEGRFSGRILENLAPNLVSEFKTILDVALGSAGDVELAIGTVLALAPNKARKRRTALESREMERRDESRTARPESTCESLGSQQKPSQVKAPILKDGESLLDILL
ncbi:hypothetical protein PG990_014667 [Apiospora arundinis]